jgi:hypothetical protein
VVSAKQSGNHTSELNGNKGEGDGVPALKNHLVETHIAAFTTGESAASVAGLRNGGFNERREIAAAMELILNAKTTEDTEITRPLGVDFTLKIEGDTAVAHVTRGDEETERNPEKKGVYGNEGAVVEENARPANEGGQKAKGGGKG